MIKLIVVEDQALLRGAIASLLSLEPDLEVVGQASDGLEALELVEQHSVDLVVTDIEMPRLGGIDLANTIRQSAADIKVMIVTTFARPGYLERARAAGVTGYVLKDAPSESLAASVRRVANGELVIEQGLAETAWAMPDPLNERERSILKLAEQGKTNKAIAKSLHLSPGTVRNYLAEATQKLSASNRIEACRIARDNGWL